MRLWQSKSGKIKLGSCSHLNSEWWGHIWIRSVNSFVCLHCIVKWHWRGKYSLGLSFWGIGLMSGVINYGLTKIIVGYLLPTYNPFVWFSGLAALSLSQISIFGWWIVGTYRSANSHNRSSDVGRKICAALSKVFLGIFAVIIVYQNIIAMLPIYRDAISNLREDPSWGERFVQLSPNGAEFEMNGALTRSLVPELRSLVKDNPTIKLLKMNSQGGRTDAAIDLHNLIVQHQLVTVVDDECSSACAIAFLGGEERWKSVGARIGFHGYKIGNEQASAANAVASSIMRNVGVPEEFIRHALGTPPTDIWFPDNGELLQNHIVTKIVESDDNGAR